MEEERNSILDKVQTWLRDEDIQENKIEDNTNDLHITFWYSKDIKLEATVFNDKLTIYCQHFFHENIKQFLSEENCNELDLLLHQQIPNFIILLNVKNLNEWVGIKIYRDIWSDSLTKTSFFDTIVAIQHSIYTIKIKEKQWSMLRT